MRKLGMPIAISATHLLPDVTSVQRVKQHKHLSVFFCESISGFIRRASDGRSSLKQVTLHALLQ